MAVLLTKTGQTNPQRSKLSSILYITSVVLSMFLLYWMSIHCKYRDCHENPTKKENAYATYFPIFASPLITMISAGWLITNYKCSQRPCTLSYNCLEMPSAVLCSLLAGISAVIVIHYSFDYKNQSWSEEWSLAAAVSIGLGAVHAILAFSLH